MKIRRRKAGSDDTIIGVTVTLSNNEAYRLRQLLIGLRWHAPDSNGLSYLHAPNVLQVCGSSTNQQQNRRGRAINQVVTLLGDKLCQITIPCPPTAELEIDEAL